MAEEPSIIEIYVDKNGELYYYIPASAECYKLILGEEVELKDDFIFIMQINLDEECGEKCGQKSIDQND